MEVICNSYMEVLIGQLSHLMTNDDLSQLPFISGYGEDVGLPQFTKHSYHLQKQWNPLPKLLMFQGGSVLKTLILQTKQVSRGFPIQV